MKTKRSTSIRLSNEAKRILEGASDEAGISQSAAMEIAIRRLVKYPITENALDAASARALATQKEK